MKVQIMAVLFLIVAFFSCPETTETIPSLPDRPTVDIIPSVVDSSVVLIDTGVITTTTKWANENSPLGINLEYAKDWVGHWPFVDAFKLARPWIPQQTSPEIWDCREGTCETGNDQLNLTTDGWVAFLKPNQAAGTLMFLNHKGRFPAGRYTVVYEGEGNLDFFWNARVIKRSPGQMLIEVTPGDEGIYMRLNSTNPLNPLKNIRILMPNFENTKEQETFHPIFIKSLSKFKIIRFQQWQMSNEQYGDAAVVEWSDLPVPELFQSGNTGVHPIWMIKLANKLHADPWFSMPYKANDDFVRQFAELVSTELDPELKVYIEYSNEVWNGLFPQQQYSIEEGMKLGLANEEWMAGWRYYSQRSVEIFDIWDEIIDSHELVRVLAGQSAVPAMGFEVMRWNDAYKKADVYATAPYIMGIGGMTVNDVLNNLEADISDVMANEVRNADHAHERGLKHIAYEGGQHLIGSNESQRDLFLQVNRDPRIKQIYLKYLDEWFAIGDDIFVYYSYLSAPSRWGTWGSLEYQEQTRANAPKYDALMTFIENYQP